VEQVRFGVLLRSVFAGIVAVFFLVCTLTSLAAAEIEYVYDDLGRLVQVIDSNNNQAILYRYDAASNITAVENKTLVTLAVSTFSPNQGPVGATVTIGGLGFSATAANNTVKFNGITAVVSTATTRQLTVTVPAGATTGPISVTVGGVSATSANSFVVSGAAQGPSITNFSPTVGIPGEVVTVNGTNFEATTQANRLSFNGVSAQVQTASAVRLTAAVPTNAGSGKIRLTTTRGIATSANDFIVAPSGYASSSISTSGRMTAGSGTSAVSLPTANRIGIRLFEGTAGDLLTIGVNSTSFASFTLKVFKPDGSELTSGVITAAAQGVQLPKLTVTGTYSIVIDPGTNTGSATIQIVTPVTGTLTVGGATFNITLTPPGRRARLTFAGTQSAYISLSLSNVTLTAGSVSIITPSGDVLISSTFGISGTALTPQLPESGTYEVVIDPQGSISGAVGVSLATSPSPILTADQASYDLNLTNQNPVALSFRATKGQYLALSINGVVAGPGAPAVRGADVRILNPDGSTLTNGTYTATCPGGPGCTYQGELVLNMGPLAVGGTYTVLVEQTSAATGTLRFTLTTPITGALTANGAGADFSVASRAQGFKLTFTATAGQYLALSINGVVAGPGAPAVRGADVRILNPDGSTLTNGTYTATCPGGPGCTYQGELVLNMGPLAVGGTYTVLVEQTSAATGTLRFTLSRMTTSTALTSSLNPSRVNQAVTFTATVTGSSPTGAVTFKDGTITIGTVALSSGVASFTTSTLTQGNHSITASYGGDISNLPSTNTSPVNQLILAPVATSITWRSSFGPPASVTVGVTFQPQAHINGSTTHRPSGSANILDGSVALTSAAIILNSNPSRIAPSITMSTPGSRTLVIQYAGDTANLPSTLSTPITVTGKVTSSLAWRTSFGPPATIARNTQFTAQVVVTGSPSGTSAVPTGTVTFKDGSTVLATATVNAGGAALPNNGVATGNISMPTTGSRTLTVEYSGDASNTAATFNTPITVN
jgi:YD repeat-containing protein